MFATPIVLLVCCNNSTLKYFLFSMFIWVHTQQTRDINSMLYQHQLNVVPMLGQRRRRWTSIGTTLGRCFVFAGYSYGSRVIKDENRINQQQNKQCNFPVVNK